MNALPELRALRDQRLLNDLDLHFAGLLGRLSGSEPAALSLAAALASNATANGHVCLELSRVAGSALGAPEVCRTPEQSAWEKILRSSELVGRPGEFRPLVLDGRGRLYLYRYWEYEQRLAGDLMRRGQRLIEGVDQPLLREGLERLFNGPTADNAGDWQKIAAATALLRNLTVISGGPGTGKTSTVVRILALLYQQAGTRPLRVALAAPTGKAAARLEESVRQARQDLLPGWGRGQELPAKATTIHRLLGSRPGTVYFRHHRDNPLPVDTLVVDEASMVDVALMSKLVEALPEESRLILLGDRNQLSSVEAGAVLGDICGEAAGFSAEFAERLSQLLGESVPMVPEPRMPSSDSVVVLRHSYRFGPQSGIGLLSEAVNRGDIHACLSRLQTQRVGGLQRLDDHRDPVSEAVSGYRPYLETVASGAAPEEVFQAFGRFRVLAALRRGRRGSEGLNAAIEQGLAAQGILDCGRRWYLGRPVLVRRNDYGLHLYNGDIGILLADEEGSEQVCFPGADGVFRRFPAARVPDHETAFAMTVHKSQGSEFDRVLLVMPDSDSPLLSRELLYTAITRARSCFQVSASKELLELAVSRRLSRSSGLQEALWGGG